MDKLEQSIKDISNNYYDYLISLQNVHGVGYGYKYINHKNTFEPCIHILVENKIDKNYISKNNLIPKSYMGIKTDVMSIGKINMASRRRKTRPLKAGSSIGVLDDYVIKGTICCIVKKKRKIAFKKYVYDYYILSNNHVLSQNGIVSIGTFVTQPPPLESELPQPIPINYDLTQIANIIATVTTFIPLKNVKGLLKFSNRVDCAIAKLVDNSLISNKILSLNKITGVSKPEIDMIINKSGAKSGLKKGKITTIHATYTFTTIPFLKDKKVIFKDQIFMEILSLPGDSGAPILTLDNKLVGMNMGISKEGFVIANDINNVFSALKVEPYLGEEI